MEYVLHRDDYHPSPNVGASLSIESRSTANSHARYAQIRRLGIRNLFLDDYLIILAAVCLDPVSFFSNS
jgi:hypothetical protein